MNRIAVAIALAVSAPLAAAQQSVKIANVVELSGTGTTAGLHPAPRLLDGGPGDTQDRVAT